MNLFNEKYYGVLTKEDAIRTFKNPYGSPNIAYNAIYPASELLADEWGWNTDGEFIEINKSSTSLSGYLSLSIPERLDVGDIIEVQASMHSVDGHLPRLGIDNVSGSLDYSTVSKKDAWEVVKIKHIVVTEGNYKVTAGLWTSFIGRCFIRDIRVIVKSRRTNVKNNRSYVITGGATGFTLVANTSEDTCTIVTSSTQITITHDKPLQTYLGVVLGNFSANNVTGKYIAKYRGQSQTGFIIEIYDTTTGLLVDPTTLRNNQNVYISCMHFA